MESIEEIVNKASIILWCCDFDGKILLQTGGGLDKKNYSVGKSIYEVFDGSDGFFEAFQQVLDKKEKVEALYKWNGDYCQTRISYTKDKVIGVCSLETGKVIRDKINAIEFALASTEKFKNDYLAIISHEIRTPLNGITGVLRLIKNESKGYNAEKYIDIIQRSVDSLLALVNDILDFSKMENKKVEIENKSLNIYHIINDITLFFYASALEKNIEIKSNIKVLQKDEMYLGDQKRLTQVLNNLLSNAVKFTPENGNINIEISQNNSNTKISVIDSGLGVSEENIEKLFEPYSQIGFQVGTGLGLSICKSLMELMKGNITYTNNPSTFSIELPLQETYFESKDDYLPIVGPIPKSQVKTMIRILIAEDDHINNLVLCRYLHRLGFLDVVSKKNGRDVYKALEDSVKTNKKFDYVLLDNKMPYMSGIEVSEKFLPLKTKEKFILVSGEYQETKTSGIDSVILKPYNIEEIEKKLK
jgi:CheY-like chemotaxis protein/anti-sigma regulatory factor (Ser/Thr protein kinase)